MKMQSSDIEIHSIEDIYIGKRIDKVISEILDIPRNQIQQYIKEGLIRVCDKTPEKSYKLKKDDCLKITIPPPKELKITPEDAPIRIIYEDEWIVVVDKPAGIVVHPGAAEEKISVVSALLFRDIKLSNIGAPLRPGVVHRIDKDTSGIIVLAKNDKAHFHLANQFFVHSIDRRYIGITACNMKAASGKIEKAIARHRTNRKIFSVSENGKPAITHYKVLKKLENMDVVMFKLETGRTHQIRVHMKAIGCPLLGDAVYGKRSRLIDRQALHAFMLKFKHPFDERIMSFYSKLPEDMKKVIGGGKS
ncbi:RluA family pseudouridine synthase [Hippea alviniae]|uniref:RluA family pseudouridine synthase n=1 Tax=Hippea alviniae TaxID=1279027 RepID=UPI0003B69BEF|nr:RluA family pseudouridine synthase [Hippea alviniae]